MILFPAPSVPQFTDTVVTIDDLLFGLDIDGVRWIFTDLQGWTLGSGVENHSTPRPGAHDMIPGPTYRRGKVITITGACVADTAELAEQANDSLAALLEDGSVGSFTVSNSRRTLTAKVHLSDSPQDDWFYGLTSFTWSLQFTADDRRKYADPTTADTSLPGGGTGLSYPLTYPLDYGDPGETGQLVLTNSGRTFSEPSFTITPPLSLGFEIARVETGQRLRYEHAVGSPLIVDCAAGTVMEAGEQRARYLTVREWFSVGPGETATFQFSTLGPETYLDPAHLSGTLAPAYP